MISLTKTVMIAGLFIPLLAFVGESSGQGAKQKKPLTKAGSLDGAAITEDQVRKEATSELESLELQALQFQAEHRIKEHDILEEALQRLLEEKMLDLEASKRGISKEQLLEELRKSIKEPTKQEIDQFYEENKNRISKSKEDAAAQIENYLKRQRERNARQELLEKLEKQHKVVRSLEPLRFTIKDAADSPSQGIKSAPVVLVLFSDFQCPYCKDNNETLKDIMKNYGTKVRLIFRQFPLTSIHPNAQRAAEASLCANAQNRFWEMHDALFANQNNLKEENINAQAKLLGLDMEAFNTCLASSRIKNAVREDIRAGAGAGTNGTPTLFINGRYLNGNRSYDDIATVIDEELAKKK
jgi:protein-disulfide isomerase